MGKMWGAEQLLSFLADSTVKPQQINYPTSKRRDGIQIQIPVLQIAGTQRCPSETQGTAYLSSPV